MAHKKGTPKVPGSGRKKGSSISGTIREYFQTKNIDLIGDTYKLIQVAADEDACRAAECMVKFLEFSYPKCRETALDFDQMTIEQLRSLGGLLLETVRSRTPEINPAIRAISGVATEKD